MSTAPTRLCLLAALSLALSASLSSHAAATATQTLRVRAATHFVGVSLVTTPSGTQVQGRLADDVGNPLAQHTVAGVSGSRALLPCAKGRDSTDIRGEFCLKLRAADADGEAQRWQLRFAGDAYLDPCQTTVPTSSAEDLNLELSVPNRTLIQGEAITVAEATLLRRAANPHEDDAFHSFVLSVSLERSGVTAVELPVPSHIRVGETVTFPIDAFGRIAPGSVRLCGRVESAPQTLGAETCEELQLLVPVSLTWDVIPQTAISDEAARFSVRTSIPVGTLNEGWIELSVKGEATAVAEVHAGHATAELPLAFARGGPVEVSARYLSASSGYAASEVLTTIVHPSPASLWRHAPWALVALVSIWWITRGWARPPRPSRLPRLQSRVVQPALSLVRASKTRTEWSGDVRDAHSGQPIVGATLRIQLPSLKNDLIARETQSDGNGRFVLEGLPHVPEGSRFVAFSPEHSLWQAPVPQRGELRLDLVQRRRTLLDALVRWTETKGKPWRHSNEATPGHVASIATQRDEAATREWARGIEGAVYGTEGPSPELEAQLLTQVPALDDVAR